MWCFYYIFINALDNFFLSIIQLTDFFRFVNNLSVIKYFIPITFTFLFRICTDSLCSSIFLVGIFKFIAALNFFKYS